MLLVSQITSYLVSLGYLYNDISNLISKSDKILDAAEAAERQTFSATSKATTRMVSER